MAPFRVSNGSCLFRMLKSMCLADPKWRMHTRPLSDQ